MNFFFLNSDLKDFENNLDRQMTIAQATADHLKIKYEDILNPTKKRRNGSFAGIIENNENIENCDMKIEEEPDLEESRQKIKRIIHDAK